ncbi:MAG: NAD(P)-dependent oxidoreductase [Beijerinckiaceae bacterium]
MSKQTTAKPRIGYLGLGLMGLPMVRHLVGKGYCITAYDVISEKRLAAEAVGALVVKKAADVAMGADFIFINLPTTESVEEVMFGKAGLATTMQTGQTIVDFSTITVEKGRSFATRLLNETGCGWVDAPVSGGPSASGTGSLTVMAGGRPEDIELVRPIMADIAQRFTVMGSSGAGLAAKMINQLIVGCTHVVLSEAMIMAEAAGIDAARIPECLSGGHADSTLLQLNYPRMVTREFTPRGYARQLLKDLEMVSTFAGALKAPAPMSGEALNLYRLLVHLGHAEDDTTAIVKVFER